MWNVGDLAVCVDEDFGDDIVNGHPVPIDQPVLRAMYRVARFRIHEDIPYIDLVELPNGGWDALNFRKVLPADPAFAECARSSRAYQHDPMAPP